MTILRISTVLGSLALAAGALSACNAPSPTQVCTKFGQPRAYEGHFRVDCLESTYQCPSPLRLDQTSNGSMYCRMRRENEID